MGGIRDNSPSVVNDPSPDLLPLRCDASSDIESGFDSIRALLLGLVNNSGEPMNQNSIVTEQNSKMNSEHPRTTFFAQILGGEPYYADGQPNFLAPPSPDYIIMPSGYAVGTDFCSYYLGNAQNFAPQMPPFEYMFRMVASGEEWVITSDGQSYDPRTGTVHPISEGGTGKPSPRLAPFYTNPQQS